MAPPPKNNRSRPLIPPATKATIRILSYRQPIFIQNIFPFLAGLRLKSGISVEFFLTSWHWPNLENVCQYNKSDSFLREKGFSRFRFSTFFSLQTDQLNLRFNYETVENFTYLTSQETALKFMIVIGLFANKKTWDFFVFRNRCDWSIFVQVPRFE